MYKTNRLVSLITILFLQLAIAGCVSMPLDYPKEPSRALTDTADTYLAGESAKWRDGQLQGNGFYSLIEGKDAFGARLVLMSEAEKSIDAQYFLMKTDNAGLVFTDKLMEAADRGVRVRLLLDDFLTTVDDSYFYYINSQPKIEVRNFNTKKPKCLYFLK
jgi:putative cardiolipin synthase